MASDNSEKNSELIRRIELAVQKRGFKSPSHAMDAASVARSTLSGWKKGTIPTPRLLGAVAGALRVSSEWLLGLDDTEPNWNDAELNPMESIECKTHMVLRDQPTVYQANGFSVMTTDQLERVLRLLVDERNWAAVINIAAELKERE